MRVDLKELLLNYGYSDKYTMHEMLIQDCTLSFLQVRDKLYVLGNILYEELESQVYVASIPAGFCDMNRAIIALQLNGNVLKVVGYAKEGSLKQNICESAFLKLKNAISGNLPTKLSKRKMGFLSFFVFVVFIAVLAICSSSFNPKDSMITKDESGNLDEVKTPVPEVTMSPEEIAFIAEVELTMEATASYNKAVEKYNMLVQKYNEAVLLTCIDNIEILPSSLDELATVNESYDANAEVVKGNNNKEKIANDTNTVLEMAKQVEQAIAVVEQITAPSGDWVMERLSTISEIIETQAVTVEQNPDGLLGKEGGYSDCIYFTIAAAIPSEVPGNSIVEKGTDAGGAIEVYATLADAEDRIEYLSGFDGTVLYSGSYAIVGTMVIRTSYKLTDELQLAITDKITRTMTALAQDSAE